MIKENASIGEGSLSEAVKEELLNGDEEIGYVQSETEDYHYRVEKNTKDYVPEISRPMTKGML